MKFSIHGFYQPRAVELGLTNDDLLVLRWFVDFAGTNKMKTIIETDGIYYWINYATILEDLPVLNISKVTLKRKHFDKLCEAKVLKHKHIKQGGSFSYYAYGINYDTLVYLQDNTPSTNLDNPSTKLDKGYDEIVQPPSTNLDNPYDKNVQTKINLLNNSSINNKSIKDNELSDEQLENEFDELWKEYPNKKSRDKALKYYKNARRDETTFEEIKQGIENYNKEIKIKKTPKQYIKHGSTWFNNKCWKDEYETEDKYERTKQSNKRDGSEYADYD